MVAELPASGAVFDPHWRTSDVVDLAFAIHQDKAFARMIVLGDALLDAGCEDEQIILACRSSDPHLHHWLLMIVLVHVFWQQAYRAMGMEEEYLSHIQHLNLNCPTDHWPIPVIQGVTPSKIIKALRDSGVNVYSYYNDIDQEVTHNDRDPANGSYTVSLKATVEPDEENKNQSANQRRQNRCQDATLIECLLQHLFYFLATGQHLSVQNWTQAAGSRNSDGRVPRLYWYAGNRKLYVCWNDPGSRDAHLRARSVVSLPTEPSEA